MIDKNHKIEFKYTAYAEYDELWPMFTLSDRPPPEGYREHKIMLSKEEVEAYKAMMTEFNKWQRIIKETCYPHVEDW